MKVSTDEPSMFLTGDFPVFAHSNFRQIFPLTPYQQELQHGDAMEGEPPVSVERLKNGEKYPRPRRCSLLAPRNQQLSLRIETDLSGLIYRSKRPFAPPAGTLTWIYFRRHSRPKAPSVELPTPRLGWPQMLLLDAMQ